MTITATREASLSLIEKFSAPKTPDALLEDALLSFTQAETKLAKAIEEVDRQTQALEAQRAALDVKVGKAINVKTRLERISGRIKDLLS